MREEDGTVTQGLIVYESYGGTTERYAAWLGETLDLPILPLSACRSSTFEGVPLLIFGGAVHGGEISGLKKLRRLLRKQDGHQTLYFATGLRAANEDTLGRLRRGNDLLDAPLWYLRGGMDKSKLTPGDKTLLRCYRAMLSRRRDLSPEDEELLCLVQIPGDYTDRESLAPLIAAAQARLTPSATAAV